MAVSFLAENAFGLQLVALAAFQYSLVNLFVKLLSREGVTSFTVVFVRGIGASILAALYLWWKKINPFLKGPITKFLVLRGFFGSCSVCCYYYAISKLDVGDATVLMFTSPLWVALFARIILKEHIGLSTVACGLGVFSGVILVAQPPFIFGSEGDSGCEDSSCTSAIAAGLLSAVFAALVLVTVRKIGKRANPFELVLYFGFVSICVSFVGLFVVQDGGDVGSLEVVLYLLGCIICGFFAQGTMNKGVARSHAGAASVVRALTVPFAFVWQATVLGNPPNIYSVLGGFIVILSAGAMTLFKVHQKKTAKKEGQLKSSPSTDELIENSSYKDKQSPDSDVALQEVL
eukprot:GCRY01004641.1.p1 GENE.GCRY01004641.1~~GCRY01004641.1.p1  ORF type:complete len:346 (-),score=71.45 GCRY01004641.1:62-1099(-)